MYHDSLGLDHGSYRLSRDADGLHLYSQQSSARWAASHSVVEKKAKSTFVPLTFLATVVFILALIWAMVRGFTNIVNGFNEEYAGQDVTLNTPLTEADRRLVPQIITRKAYEKKHKKVSLK